MSDIIRLLPDSVANQIAAGEVIQRPASVIKELVENAIDAGAQHIDVLVTDAGKSSIQVVDDGKGMSETDARLSFERHATSKIREAADLFALRTMGFRGEALASIAAVAQVELRTCVEGEELGTKLVIAGSKVESQEAISCPKGSNFCVKNLFFNVPARRKFLKSNQTELSNILTEFERIALVNPNVSFTLYHNDAELFNLPAIQLRQRIMGVFGKKINQDLLSLDVDPGNIDVNIHPTKTEIKFENEQAIWQILAAAVKETLGKFNAVPSIDFDTEGMPDIPAFESSPYAGIQPPKTTYNPDYNPFNTSAVPPSSYSSKPSRDWEQLYEGLEHHSSAQHIQKSYPDDGDYFTAASMEQPVTPTLYDHSEEAAMGEKSSQHYQFKGRFILTSVKSGLMIIDQQRAHIRILYDQYLEQITRRQGASQGMLFPDIVQFPVSEVPVLQEIMEDLSYLGFELTDLGGGSYAINGIPSGISGLNPVELIQSMVHTAMEKGGKVKEEVQSNLALTLAKAAAIVPGQVLTNEEMNGLVDGLFAVATPNYTPDGKTVLSVLQEDELEKLFK